MPEIFYHASNGAINTVLGGFITPDGQTLTVVRYIDQEVAHTVYMPGEVVEGELPELNTAYGDGLAPHLAGKVFAIGDSIDLAFATIDANLSDMFYLTIDKITGELGWLNADDITVQNGWPQSIVDSLAPYYDSEATLEEYNAISIQVIADHIDKNILMRLRSRRHWQDVSAISGFHEATFRITTDSKGAIGHFYSATA